MIRGPPGRRRIHAFETQSMEIQLFDEDIDDSHWIVFTDKVVKALWQQRHLLSVENPIDTIALSKLEEIPLSGRTKKS